MLHVGVPELLDWRVFDSHASGPLVLIVGEEWVVWMVHQAVLQSVVDLPDARSCEAPLFAYVYVASSFCYNCYKYLEFR